MTNKDTGKKSLSFWSVEAFMTERSTGMTALDMDDKTEHPSDLDSHANTCVVDMNALIVHVLDKKVNVSGFDPSQVKVKDHKPCVGGPSCLRRPSVGRDDHC
jgi:hypothetical protein